jgi:hypothetical protein|tara:strand:+ start:1515 stop:1871 length:357 start_codon:yes stop_codon:yes gene_type:complete
MQTPIYSSEEHRMIVDSYITMCKQFTEEVASQARYKNYLEVIDLIVEYSNGYGEGVRENNFYDWLVILPINLSVATSGFYAGIETKSNAAVVRAYKVVLEQMLTETVTRLDSLEPDND